MQCQVFSIWFAKLNFLSRALRIQLTFSFSLHFFNCFFSLFSKVSLLCSFHDQDVCRINVLKSLLNWLLWLYLKQQWSFIEKDSVDLKNGRFIRARVYKWVCAYAMGRRFLLYLGVHFFQLELYGYYWWWFEAVSLKWGDIFSGSRLKVLFCGILRLVTGKLGLIVSFLQFVINSSLAVNGSLFWRLSSNTCNFQIAPASWWIITV